MYAFTLLYIQPTVTCVVVVLVFYCVSPLVLCRYHTIGCSSTIVQPPVQIWELSVGQLVASGLDNLHLFSPLQLSVVCLFVGCFVVSYFLSTPQGYPCVYTIITQFSYVITSGQKQGRPLYALAQVVCVHQQLSLYFYFLSCGYAYSFLFPLAQYLSNKYTCVFSLLFVPCFFLLLQSDGNMCYGSPTSPQTQQAYILEPQHQPTITQPGNLTNLASLGFICSADKVWLPSNTKRFLPVRDRPTKSDRQTKSQSYEAG